MARRHDLPQPKGSKHGSRTCAVHTGRGPMTLGAQRAESPQARRERLRRIAAGR